MTKNGESQDDPWLEGVKSSRTPHPALLRIIVAFIRLLWSVIVAFTRFIIGSPNKTLPERFHEAVQTHSYKRQYLLNKPEKEVYWTLVRLLGKRYCINPQVSLGEILQCDSSDTLAYRAINSKRVDFAITDRSFCPIAVVEYQGQGHYQGNYQLRDDTKRIALEKAGIRYIELFASSESCVLKALRSSGLIEKDH